MSSLRFFVLTQFSGRNRLLDPCGVRGEYVQWQKELQHCIVTYSQEFKYYAYTKYIALIREQFQTTSTTFETKNVKKKPTKNGTS